MAVIIKHIECFGRLSGNCTRAQEDEYQVFVRPVACPRVLEAFERHGGLAVSDARVAVDDLPSGDVVPCVVEIGGGGVRRPTG